ARRPDTCATGSHSSPRILHNPQFLVTSWFRSGNLLLLGTGKIGTWRRLMKCARTKGKRGCGSRRARESYYRLEGLESRMLLSALTIVQENQLPGTPSSSWSISGSGDATIQGFPTSISVNVGQPISFKITDTASAPYHIDIYRMGYYQGNGARLVTTIASSQTLAVVQPNPITDTNTGLVDAGNWKVTATWSVPSDATSGIYFANIVREDTGGKSQMYFVVRN